jgi:Flp pilus assembly protein TadG
MNPKGIYADTRGAVLVEAAITLPLFILMIFGLVELGLLMWTQAGLQHGAEMAARHATTLQVVNGTNPSNSTIQNFAAAQSLGVNPPSATFTYTPGATCNQVSASYPFNLFGGDYNLSTTSWTLTAQSCFPLPN